MRLKLIKVPSSGILVSLNENSESGTNFLSLIKRYKLDLILFVC